MSLEDRTYNLQYARNLCVNVRNLRVFVFSFIYFLFFLKLWLLAQGDTVILLILPLTLPLSLCFYFLFFFPSFFSLVFLDTIHWNPRSIPI